MAFHKVPSLAIAALLAFTPASVAFAQDTGSDTPAVQAEAAPAASGPDAKRERGPRGKRMTMIERLDTNGDGSITIEEFATVGERPMARFDADGNGSITTDEIDDALVERMIERRRQHILDRFDLDADGTITAEEMQRQREKVFALMDRNDDGTVDAKEMRTFRKLMREMAGPEMHKGKGPGHLKGKGHDGHRGKHHASRGDDCGPRGGDRHGWRGHGADGPRGERPGWHQGDMRGGPANGPDAE
ncbi:EF-hand domain-containing protein [Amorphus coralli]|uniref:EF-hand domain-containing protein n=1 Tax=Amorphus coralli TaxID=340680 RepID=UPI00035ED2C0|nr:EF-hand domain-containing protein [Amorphus coralli]